MAFRPEFLAGLEILAEAGEEMVRRGFARPVLVGGAAVEYYTGSAIVSGDFDVVCGAQQQLEEILVGLGFERSRSIGEPIRGLYHPQIGLGFEVVGGHLMDGKAEANRLRMVSMKQGHTVVIPIEDLIADRLRQFAMSRRGPPEMLRQAIALFHLARDLDETYLDRRIREESFDTFDLDYLRARS